MAAANYRRAQMVVLRRSAITQRSINQLILLVAIIGIPQWLGASMQWMYVEYPYFVLEGIRWSGAVKSVKSMSPASHFETLRIDA
ncbi:hypothetical protein L209DRAFT_237593 [Thermothelomyces heterothallicus CBS 203.75]